MFDLKSSKLLDDCECPKPCCIRFIQIIYKSVWQLEGNLVTFMTSYRVIACYIFTSCTLSGLCFSRHINGPNGQSVIMQRANAFHEDCERRHVVKTTITWTQAESNMTGKSQKFARGLTSVGENRSLSRIHKLVSYREWSVHLYLGYFCVVPNHFVLMIYRLYLDSNYQNNICSWF